MACKICKEYSGASELCSYHVTEQIQKDATKSQLIAAIEKWNNQAQKGNQIHLKVQGFLLKELGL